LDYSFNVLVSKSRKLRLYNWFAIFTLLDTSLFAHVLLCLRHSF